MRFRRTIIRNVNPAYAKPNAVVEIPPFLSRKFYYYRRVYSAVDGGDYTDPGYTHAQTAGGTRQNVNYLFRMTYGSRSTCTRRLCSRRVPFFFFLLLLSFFRDFTVRLLPRTQRRPRRKRRKTGGGIRANALPTPTTAVQILRLHFGPPPSLANEPYRRRRHRSRRRPNERGRIFRRTKRNETGGPADCGYE